MLVLQLHAVHAQINNHTERNALFLYNFAKYINWSVYVDQSAIVIGVAGDEEIYNYMREHFSDRIIRQRRVKIKRVNSIDAADCQILYVSNLETEQNRNLLDYVRHLQVLIVTDSRVHHPEVDIAILSMGNRPDDYSIKINRQTIRSKGLKISTELMVFTRETTWISPSIIRPSNELLFYSKSETLGV